MLYKYYTSKKTCLPKIAILPVHKKIDSVHGKKGDLCLRKCSIESMYMHVGFSLVIF